MQLQDNYVLQLINWQAMHRSKNVVITIVALVVVVLAALAWASDGRVRAPGADRRPGGANAEDREPSPAAGGIQEQGALVRQDGLDEGGGIVVGEGVSRVVESEVAQILVVDGATMGPLAHVSAVAWVQGVSVTLETNLDGVAKCHGMPTVVSADSAGYAKSHHQVTSEEKSDSRIVVKLVRCGDLLVKLMDSGGRMLELQDVEVKYVRPDRQRPDFLRYQEQRSDDKGIVLFSRVPAGKWNVSAGGIRGYDKLDTPTEVEVKVGVVAEHVVVLEQRDPGTYISGVVNAGALESVMIKGEGGANDWYVIEPDGMFVLEGDRARAVKFRIEMVDDEKKSQRVGEWMLLRKGMHGVNLSW